MVEAVERREGIGWRGGGEKEERVRRRRVRRATGKRRSFRRVEGR